MAAKDKIKMIRLITGEDILAEVIAEARGQIEVKNAIRVVVMPNKLDPTIPSIGFAPFLQFSKDDRHYINQTSVLTVYVPVDDFIDQYNSMFSKIIQPSVATQTPSKLIGI